MTIEMNYRHLSVLKPFNSLKFGTAASGKIGASATEWPCTPVEMRGKLGQHGEQRQHLLCVPHFQEPIYPIPKQT